MRFLLLLFLLTSSAFSQLEINSSNIDFFNIITNDLKRLKTLRVLKWHPVVYDFLSAQHLSGPALYHYIDEVTLGFKHDESSENAYAYFDSQFNKIVMTKFFLLNKNISQLQRINVYLHEAAHSARNFYQNRVKDHAKCPSEFYDEFGTPYVSASSGIELAGIKACAKRYYDSNLLSYAFLDSLIKYCENCTEVELEELLIHRDDALVRVLPQSLKEKLFIEY